MFHPIYLPFTEAQLRSHFAEVRKNGNCSDSSAKHIRYYKNSLANYVNCPQGKERKGTTLSHIRKPCQVEKDEKFWTVSCLMTVFHSNNRIKEFAQLFKNAYGDKPPIAGIKNWHDCLNGELHLFFETNLPSPVQYKKWLRKNLHKQQFIPYILDSDNGKKNLEGPTNVDAILLNENNGFSVIIEAKVLSDISCHITYDVLRNQIARNIDVMLDRNDALCPPLNHRDPEKTLFLLLTPQLFKDNPQSRLYGYKMNEYMTKPDSLQFDLPHRTECDWNKISKRLGWLTWEDFRETNINCSNWLKDE
jgi:hypothetical protein